MLRRLFLLAVLGPLLGSANVVGQPADLLATRGGDAYRLQLFTQMDRRVVAVGETVPFTVEGLAVPATDEAAHALIAAFSRLAFPRGIHASFDVVRAEDPIVRRRENEPVYELSRRFLLRPLQDGEQTIPSLPVVLDGAVYQTRPQTLRVYTSQEGLAAAQRSVVPLVAESARNGRLLRRIGSGFFLAEDALVTAYHVVLDANVVRLTLPDGRRVSTDRVWAIDPARDVAVLYVSPRSVERAGVEPLRLSERFDPDLLGLEEEGATFTAGWPSGVQQASRGGRYPSLRFGTADVLRVASNPVRPGDSGGPLLDEEGRVLGVVSSGRSTGGHADVLREDLCLATDPRRAWAQRLAQSEPQSMRRMLRDVAQDPNATVLQAASLLATTPDGHPEAERQLARVVDAVRQAPHDVTLQFLAGSVFQAYGDDALAADAYRAAVDDVADYFPAVYALGHVHFERGEYGHAEGLFARTRAFAPYARLGAFGLARVQTARLDYTAAAASLAEVLDHDPQFAPALYLLGYGLLAQGRDAEADAIAIRLDRLDPSWANTLRLHIRRDALRPVALAALPRVKPTP